MKFWKIITVESHCIEFSIFLFCIWLIIFVVILISLLRFNWKRIAFELKTKNWEGMRKHKHPSTAIRPRLFSKYEVQSYPFEFLKKTICALDFCWLESMFVLLLLLLLLLTMFLLLLFTRTVVFLCFFKTHSFVSFAVVVVYFFFVFKFQINSHCCFLCFCCCSCSSVAAAAGRYFTKI